LTRIGKTISQLIIQQLQPKNMPKEDITEEPIIEEVELPASNMLGYCSACGKKIINMEIKGGKASLRKLDNFRENMIELSNGTLMRVAVCDSCKEELVAGNSMAKAQEILDNHVIYWEKQDKQEVPLNYASLEVVNSNTDLGTFIKKIEEEKALEEKSKSLNLK